MSSDTSSDSSDYNPRPSRGEHRTAKKSTAQPTYTTRRQAAKNASKALRSSMDQFLSNFNPENSTRERRKLTRKIHPPSNVRRPAGSLYDENGIHIASATDVCDCLNEDCVGCFFECSKCGSQKCGTECRVHRKYIIEQIEYHGYDHVIKNPVIKN